MTILLVDDHPEILDLWERFLEPLNATVLKASDFAGALELMRRVPHPDIVLLDLRLPDTASKAETLDSIVKLRDLNPFCAVVALTGLLDEDTRRLGMKAADFIGDKRDMASQVNLLNAVKAGLSHAGGGTDRCIDMIETVSHAMSRGL